MRSLNNNLFVYIIIINCIVFIFIKHNYRKKVPSFYKVPIINYFQSMINLFNSPLLHNTQYFNKPKARYLANQNINCIVPFYRLEGLDDE